VTALIVSTLVSLLMAGGFALYSSRRDPENHMTWGESSVMSVYIMFIFFLVFGIVPHQWLTLAENEWSFRADKIWDAWGLITAQSQGGWFPFEVTYRVLSDSIAAVIYIVFLGAMVAMWVQWQGRGKVKKAELPSSTYGRPLVKRG
jgi:hypothetical protein